MRGNVCCYLLFFVICIFIHQLLSSFHLGHDSITKQIDSLSIEEKIGQLFMVAVVADMAENELFLSHSSYTLDPEYISMLIQKYAIGGIIFLGKNHSSAYKRTLNKFQSESKIPLIVGADCEWGIAMRITDYPRFPYALTVGALTNSELTYQLGYAIGHECRAAGIDIAYGPVADCNTNSLNPMINYRSFGQYPWRVTEHATAYAQGLHDAGVIACAKHFPGHGNTTIDSHYELPVLLSSTSELESDMYPFKYLIFQDIPALMIGHLAVPAYDSTYCPASLSYPIVTQFLKETLQFKGLVITDGLGMQALTHQYLAGDIAVRALQAGNDILLCPTDVAEALGAIKIALKNGVLTEQYINNKVQKILTLKKSILANRNSSSYPVPMLTTIQLRNSIYQQAITVVQDRLKLLPVAAPRAYKLLQLGNEKNDALESIIHKGGISIAASHHFVNSLPHDEFWLTYLDTLNNNDCIIVFLTSLSNSPGTSYGVTSYLKDKITSLNKKTDAIILVHCGNPYALAFFSSISTIICAYEDDILAQNSAAEVVAGLRSPMGTLPVNPFEST